MNSPLGLIAKMVCYNITLMASNSDLLIIIVDTATAYVIAATACAALTSANTQFKPVSMHLFSAA